MKSVSRRVELLGVVAAGAVRAFLQLLLELAEQSKDRADHALGDDTE